MATNPNVPMAVILAAIPSLPRAALARLTQRMIDRLDDMDGDPDAEDDDSDREHDGREPDGSTIRGGNDR